MSTGVMVVAGAYLVGGIPFGFLIYKLTRGGDVRKVGSGNIGATNIARTAGWALGVTTLILDAGKGALAAWAGLRLTGDAAWAAGAAFAAVAGHCFPVWLAFRGGKGVATGAGAFLLLDPIAMGAAIAIFVVAAGLTRMVAVGSILSAVGYAAVSLALAGARPAALWSAAAAMLIVIRHQANIRRILRGEEKQLWGRGKVEAK